MGKLGVKYGKDTVRKNVTLSDGTVKFLEEVSALCGLTQSHVLEIALCQPVFRMTRVFVEDSDDSREHAGANLVLAARGTQDVETCKRTLRLVNHWVVPKLRLKTEVDDEWSPGEFMAYVRYTMPPFMREASSFMASFVDKCVHGEYAEFDEAVLKQLIKDYIGELLLYVDQPSVFLEPRLYQILYVMLDCLFQPNTDEERDELYKHFADDGVVLSEKSVMDMLR